MKAGLFVFPLWRITCHEYTVRPVWIHKARHNCAFVVSRYLSNCLFWLRCCFDKQDNLVSDVRALGTTTRSFCRLFGEIQLGKLFRIKQGRLYSPAVPKMTSMGLTTMLIWSGILRCVCVRADSVEFVEFVLFSKKISVVVSMAKLGLSLVWMELFLQRKDGQENFSSLSNGPLSAL